MKPGFYSKIIYSASLLTLLVSIIFLSGCKKDDSNPAKSSDNPVDSLSFKFVNNYVISQDWVYYKSVSDTSYKIARSVSGNMIINCGKVNSQENEFTIVHSSLHPNGYIGITIKTYLKAPAGVYIFSGQNYRPSGSLYCKATFSLGNYDCGTMAITNSGGYGLNPSYSQPRSSYNAGNLPVDYPAFNEKHTVFYSMTNKDSGFCAWKSDFVKGAAVDTVSMVLTRTMRKASITPSIPMTNHYLYAIINSSYDNVIVSHQSKPVNNVFYIFYPPAEFHVEKYLGTFYNLDSSGTKMFYYISPSIPSSVTIPSSVINYTYDDYARSYQNISISGNIDRLETEWSYTDYAKKIYYTWIVCAPAAVTQVAFPAIPPTLAQDIGLDISLLKGSALTVFDYNSCDSYSGYLKAFMQSEADYYSKFSNYYYHRKLVK